MRYFFHCWRIFSVVTALWLLVGSDVVAESDTLSDEHERAFEVPGTFVIRYDATQLALDTNLVSHILFTRRATIEKEMSTLAAPFGTSVVLSHQSNETQPAGVFIWTVRSSGVRLPSTAPENLEKEVHRRLAKVLEETLAQNLDSQLETETSRLAMLNKNIDQLKAEYDQLQNQISEIRPMPGETLESLAQEVEDYNRQLSQTTLESSELSVRHEQLLKVTSELPRIVADQKKKYQDLDTHLALLKKQLVKQNPPQAEVERVTAELDALLPRISSNEGRLDAAYQELQESAAQLERSQFREKMLGERFERARTRYVEAETRQRRYQQLLRTSDRVSAMAEELESEVARLRMMHDRRVPVRVYVWE